jgi:hypothetical protein
MKPVGKQLTLNIFLMAFLIETFLVSLILVQTTKLSKSLPIMYKEVRFNLTNVFFFKLKFSLFDKNFLNIRSIRHNLKKYLEICQFYQYYYIL